MYLSYPLFRSTGIYDIIQAYMELPRKGELTLIVNLQGVFVPSNDVA